jgi:hypothetical protein
MQVIVGGKFEAALIHEMDEINNPHRNRTSHPYYLGLNRKPDKRYFERLATFLAVVEDIVVPVADWSDAAGDEGVSGANVGLISQTGSLNEWDPGAHAFAEKVIKSGALPKPSLSYISDLDLSSFDDNERRTVEQNMADIAQKVAVHYLCRLFLQVREAGLQGALLVIDEEDVKILSKISDFILDTGTIPPFPFPNLSEKVILGSEFAGGLLNFSPRDMQSVAAIRKDPEVQRYAAMVRKVFGQTASLNAERDLLTAMRESYKAVGKRQKIDRVFEVVGWIAKPLHYVPGIDAALSIAEDVKDVGQILLEKDKETKEWYLLAARATQVNIEEYLARKQNL